MTPTYDSEIFDDSNMYMHDDKLVAFFHLMPVKLEVESKEQGRLVCTDIEYITIITPGQRDTLVTEVTDQYRHRFQKRYDAWKSKMEAPESGTPLSEVPWLTPSQIAEFNWLHIKTVEQLVNLSDSVAQKIMDFHRIKARAQRFLDAATAAAPDMKLEAELAKRDETIEEMKAQIAALIGAQQTPKPVMAPVKKA
jgi:hypothetical protein